MTASSRASRSVGDPTALALRRIFDGALRVSLGAVAVGCDAAEWPRVGDGFEPVSCDPLAGLMPTVPP